MPFPNPATQFKPGQSGNKGHKGYKHISHWIQEMLNDENFTLENFLGNGKAYKGAPLRAIITVGYMNALQGDEKWAHWLAKYGYGDKLNIDLTSGGQPIQFVNQLSRPAPQVIEGEIVEAKELKATND